MTNNDEPRSLRRWVAALMMPLSQRVSLYQYLETEFARFLQTHAESKDPSEQSSALRCYELALKSYGQELQEISIRIRALQALAVAKAWPQSHVVSKAVDEIQNLERAKFLYTAQFQLQQKEALFKSCQLAAQIHLEREQQQQLETEAGESSTTRTTTSAALIADWEEFERMKAQLADKNTEYFHEKHRLNGLISEQIQEIHCTLEDEEEEEEEKE